jgi:imidazolonepropionase
MLLHSASQVITVKGGPQKGARLGELGSIPNGGVLFRDGVIQAVGDSDDLLRKYPNEERISANHCAVLPGLVDPHTHLVWAGDRAAEFEMRLEGKSYLEIMQAGGGIQSTVNATRTIDKQSLFAESVLRARAIFSHGTTTAEAKSGYGLDLETECKQLEVAMALNEAGPLEIVPTFLGAHAIPKEYAGNPQTYVDLLCGQILADIRSWWKNKYPENPLPFVDVFCEKGAFDLQQTRQILQTAKSLGYPLKIHADEFENLGGASLAAEMGAVSADHLVKTSTIDISNLSASHTIAVSLPCTPFGLADASYTPALEMIKAGCTLAIASDLNPGTAWCGNMQFTMALACRYMKITPAQAVTAATINAAAAINRQDRIGSIEAGKQADMIILSEPDYRQLAYRFGINLVEKVIKKGVIYGKDWTW